MMLPVAKWKSRRAPSSGHFLRKVCKKNKRYSGHNQFGLLRDASMLGPRMQLPSILEKHVFFQNTFFSKTKTWLSVQRGRRPRRVPLLMPLSMRPGPTLFTFASYTHSHFYFLSQCPSLRRDFEQVFCIFFFRRVFGPARVQIFYVPLLRSVFVLQRQTNVFKSSCGVRGTGPPQGSAFACAVTTVNKTKKQN